MVRLMKAYNISLLGGNLEWLLIKVQILPYIDITVQNVLCGPVSINTLPPDYTLDITFLMGLPPYIVVMSCTVRSLENGHGIHSLLLVEIVMFSVTGVLQVYYRWWYLLRRERANQDTFLCHHSVLTVTRWELDSSLYRCLICIAPFINLSFPSPSLPLS